MFFGWVWIITVIAGSILRGDSVLVASPLTENLTATALTVTVESTVGYPKPGIIVIDDEQIAYSTYNAVTFMGTFARPLVRGSGGTTATTHTAATNTTPTTVRTLEGSLVNNSVDFAMATLADASGLLAFITVPIALYNILISYITSPFQFLGTDLQIVTILWGIMSLGLVVTLLIAMVGGRRV